MRHPTCVSTATLLMALLLGGCSREREITGQIFLVTKSSENVKMGLVAVHVLSDEELKVVAEKVFDAQSASSTSSVGDRLFAILPPAVVKTDADGQFTIRTKGKVWLVARASRRVGSDFEVYHWAISTEGRPAKLLLSNLAG